MFKRFIAIFAVFFMLIGPAAPATAGTDTSSIDQLIVEPGFSAAQADMLRLYRAFFDREPDPAGTEYWLGEAERGASLDVIAESFAVSDEFVKRYGATTDEQFLDIVYRNVLGRDYDQAGFQYWLGQLQTKLTRGGTVRWVAANDEFVVKHPYPRQALRVASITDGDSLKLDDGRKVRLAQVDGPEYNECFGTEATNYLASLVDGREVFLRRPATAPELDQYGRTVAEVLVMDGGRLTSVNELIVRNGYGEFYDSFADEDPALAARLRSAEQSAKAEKLGLWSACAATPQEVPSTPVTPTPAPPTGNCHPAYDPCVPPPGPDLDCKDIGRRVRVDWTHGDPHRLDGDRDGWGCESYG